MPVQYMTDPQLDAYLTSNGNLDGTPTVAGAYTFDRTVVDSNGCTQVLATQTIVIA